MHSALFRRLAFEQTFSRRLEGGLVATSVIDVHWEVAPPFVMSFDFETLKQHTIEVDLFGRTIRTFSPELSIVLLCCHGTKHQWAMLKWIVDIAAVIQAHPGLNWQTVYDTASKFGVASKVDLALLLSRELPWYQLNLSEAVSSRLQAAQKSLHDFPHKQWRVGSNLTRRNSICVATGTSNFRLLIRSSGRRIFFCTNFQILPWRPISVIRFLSTFMISTMSSTRFS